MLYKLPFYYFNIWQVFKKCSNETQHMYDVCDGEVYKTHPLFASDGSALQILIYTDDVETANPLGSYRGQQKLSYNNVCGNLCFFTALIIVQLFSTMSLEISHPYYGLL